MSLDESLGCLRQHRTHQTLRNAVREAAAVAVGVHVLGVKTAAPHGALIRTDGVHDSPGLLEGGEPHRPRARRGHHGLSQEGGSCANSSEGLRGGQRVAFAQRFWRRDGRWS
eukprot:scaffold3291_cov229-Pinguiococcus_pyrenoidosus.AAC.2